MASSVILSQTLQSITLTKIHELEKQRQTYEKRKAAVLRLAEKSDDIRKKVLDLHDGVKELGIWSKSDLQNIHSWVQQSAYDPSVSDGRLQQFEQQLRSALEIQSQKLDLAGLYCRLLVEWIDSPKGQETESSQNGMDDSYEIIESIQKERLQQLREKFARVVFEPLEVDERAIDNYLNSLFQGDNGEKALKRIRANIEGFGALMDPSKKKLFDLQELRWCIKSLLKNGLLDDEKKASLGAFLQDEAVLNEIKDVLNMRYAELWDWSWGLGDRGMPVVPRQSLNGKWRVIIDEDVLQTMLIHWISTLWSVRIKELLKDVVKYTRVWKKKGHLPYEQRTKLEYYVDDGLDTDDNIETARHKNYMDHFFLAPLPSNQFEEAGGYDEEDEEDQDSQKMSPKDVRQLLLRTLATEVLVRRSLDGEAAVVQSDFQWFGTGLSHGTIFAVLRFLGLSSEWISFFRKAVEQPLDMLTGRPVKIRRRGLPMAHMLEQLLGEVVLFFMDLAVNQQSEINIYRLHDDLWLCGKPSSCAKGWKAMEQFAKIMGLEFNRSKTGSVYLVDGDRNKKTDIAKSLPDGPVVVNFLALDPKSGEWVINREHVLEHVKQLRKQLTGCNNILEWVKTWNSCIGNFFSHTFGEPAQCFGRKHLDNVLKTHSEIQKFLFSDQSANCNSVSKYLNHNISHRFNVSVFDAFLYLPDSLGGLGVHNPFTSLLVAGKNLNDDPKAKIEECLEEDRKAYAEAKKSFEEMSEYDRRNHYNDVFETSQGNTPPISWEEAQTFISYDEYMEFCESRSYRFYTMYKFLMSEPKRSGTVTSERVRTELRRLTSGRDESSFLSSVDELDLDKMKPDKAWIIEFYSGELFSKFGGLSMVDNPLFPIGVLKAMRNKKVTWQMAL